MREASGEELTLCTAARRLARATELLLRAQERQLLSTSEAVHTSPQDSNLPGKKRAA